MADPSDYDIDPRNEDTGPPPAAAMPQPLQDLKDTFQTDAGKDWANDATTRIQDYVMQRQVAEQNTAAGQQFIQNIDNFKDGLVSFVQQDPLGVHLALDLVPGALDAVISTMPGRPEDAADHHAAMTASASRDIAAAAVTSMAGRNPTVARNIYDHPRIQDALGDSAPAMDSYITLQGQAHERDAQVGQANALRQQQQGYDTNARGYLSLLSNNPLADDFNKAVVADQGVPPADKLELLSARERILAGSGNQPSDPIATMNLVSQLASNEVGQKDLYSRIGRDLSVNDASMLSSIHATGQTGELHDLLQFGKQWITGPGPGSPAEVNALGRYVNFALAHARTNGNLDPFGGDPKNVDQVMHAFRVTGEDLVAGRVASGNPRPSLNEIFSKDYRGPEFHRERLAIDMAGRPKQEGE
jgi:hypothetical protein